MKVNLQDPGAGSTDERAHCHVDIGRAALVAIEAFPIRGQASHFPEHLQMSLLLLSLRTRRHGRKQWAANSGDKCGKGEPGRGRVSSVWTRRVLVGWQSRHLAGRSTTETRRLTIYFFYKEKVIGAPVSGAQRALYRHGRT